MGLSPEERRKIYEEEKARIEARDHLEREKRAASSETSTGLTPNIAALLCYIGGWITGIIFFIIEQRNATVRFHAAQSILIFGSLTVIGSIFSIVPFVGDFFSAVIGIIGFILWIVLLIKSYNGEIMRFGVVSELAERMAGSGPVTSESNTIVAKEPETRSESGEKTEFVNNQEPVRQPEPRHIDFDKEIGRKVEEYFTRKRSGRIAGSAFIIAFSIALLIFFNFFYDYVAYYSSSTVAGIELWTRASFFTSEIHLWLPVMTTALLVAIVGHIIVIILDYYVLRELVMMVIDMFSLASVITLVSVYPFNFYVIPDWDVAEAVTLIVKIILIFICVGIGIGILSRGIKLVVNLFRGHTSYEKGA